MAHDGHAFRIVLLLAGLLHLLELPTVRLRSILILGQVVLIVNRFSLATNSTRRRLPPASIPLTMRYLLNPIHLSFLLCQASEMRLLVLLHDLVLLFLVGSCGHCQGAIDSGVGLDGRELLGLLVLVACSGCGWLNGIANRVVL